jgi:hypothetical protein
VQRATRAGSRMLWFSARRACVGFTSHVVVLPAHCRGVVGCVAPVLWQCMFLQVVLQLVIPLCTTTAGNGARAHGARAKAGTPYFFLSFFLFDMLAEAPAAVLQQSTLLGQVAATVQATYTRCPANQTCCHAPDLCMPCAANSLGHGSMAAPMPRMEHHHAWHPVSLMTSYRMHVRWPCAWWRQRPTIEGLHTSACSSLPSRVCLRSCGAYLKKRRTLYHK